jgi:osmoprotectant transport system substrate-binding protein
VRLRRPFAVAAAAVLVLSFACSDSKPAITVGSANFPESFVLAEIYAQGLQAKGFEVNTKLDIGTRETYFPGLVRGDVDLFPEYTGSALVYLSKDQNASTPDPQKNYTNLVAQLKKKNLTALDMADAINTDEIVTNKQTADKYNLKKLSDLKPVASQLVMGGPPECPTRHACLKGLQEVYGINFKQFKPLDTAGPLTIAALKDNGIQVANLFSTQPQILANNFVVLEQDPAIHGAENVVPIVRDEVLTEGGDDLRTAVNAITAKLTTDDLLEFNKETVTDKKDPEDVAGAWLKANGLV